MLFERGTRKRQEYQHRGEKLFDFYNSCGRDGYDQFRSIVNHWLEEMPQDDGAKLVADMSKGEDAQFQHGLCELIIHALLIRLTFHVEVHPKIETSDKKPDFAAIADEDTCCTYIEVTTINRNDSQVGEENRENLLYNAIDAITLPPGCMLGYQLLKTGKESPPLKIVARQVEGWANDNADAAQDERISNKFEVGDWELKLRLFPTTNTEPATRAIGFVSAGGEWTKLPPDLRKALGGKSRRYGTLNSPYLIVVANCTDQPGGDDEIIETLLGDEILAVDESGKARLARNQNGFWMGRDGPRNMNVSGFLMLPSTQLWTLRSKNHQPRLAINPWAEHTLPEQFFTLPRMDMEGEKLVFHDGIIVADILGLPDPWPPIEGG